MLVAVGVAAVGLTSCSSGPSGSSSSPAVARWRFVGGGALQSQSGAPALAALLGGSNSIPAGDRLATNLVRALCQRLGRPAGADVAVLSPLMRDLLRHESAGEVTSTGWRITVRLPADRWPAWQKAGGTLASLSAQAAPVLGYTNGWLTAGAGKVGGGGWLALTNGNVLVAEGDLARVVDGLAAQWPRVRVGAGFEDGKVVTRAQMDFTAPPLGPLPEWKLPERMAHGPFSQFVAMRGAQELGGRLDWWREAFGGRPPAQLFAWSQPEVPFRNWIAVPSQDPSGDLERWFQAFGRVFGGPGTRTGRVVMATNHSAFAVLDTLKGLQPVVSPVRQGNDTFLLASIFPAERSTNALSAPLRRRLAEKDVAYLDAEFTPEAVDHWNVLFQLDQMLQGRLPNARNARAHAWMIDNRSALGDSETVVRQVTPTRLAFERRSSAGVTGLELVLLTRWIDGQDNQVRRMALPPTPPDTSPNPKP